MQSIVLFSEPTGNSNGVDTAFVTLPASLKSYFENEDGAWRTEALKKTIASYRKVKVDAIELIFV